jgi:glycerol-3-phosphate acyltransferase PlsY
MVSLIAVILLAFLFGSIPFGIIVSKCVRGIDIREVGSGNIGSTNVSRVLGFKYGLIVQIGDILKGFIAPSVIAPIFFYSSPIGDIMPTDNYILVQIIAGISAVMGHVWTLFAGFKGGKGVNTTVGVLIGLAPVDLLIAFSVFLVVLFISGYVSLGSLMGSISFPSAMFIRFNLFHVEIKGYHTLIVFAIIICTMIIYTHRSNIVRLRNRTENRFNRLMVKNWFKKKG